MKIIVKDCFGKIEKIYKNEGNLFRAFAKAQKIVLELITQNGIEDNIYSMRWKRVLNGYNIYDNFGSGICYKIRICK